MHLYFTLPQHFQFKRLRKRDKIKILSRNKEQVIKVSNQFWKIIFLKQTGLTSKNTTSKTEFSNSNVLQFCPRIILSNSYNFKRVYISKSLLFNSDLLHYDPLDHCCKKRPTATIALHYILSFTIYFILSCIVFCYVFSCSYQ